jgi:hypothetical protein
MADITELFSFLMPDKAAEEAIAANDPWTPLQAAPDLMSQLLMKESQDPSRSTTELMLGGLLSGLGSGYLGKLSSNYQTEKLADYTALLPGMADGTVTGRPENMSQDVFNIATKKANQHDIFQRMQDKEDETNIAKQLIQQIAQEDPMAAAEASNRMLGTNIDVGALPPMQNTSRELRERQLDEIQQRHEDAKEVREAETSFQGYEFRGKVRPTRSEAASVRKEIGYNTQLISTLQSLGDNIDENGFMSLFGDNPQLQEALQSFIFNTQRKATGSGARLEGPEAKMLKAMTPSVLAGNPLGAIKSALLDRNPAQLAKDMIKLIKKSQNEVMRVKYEAFPTDPFYMGIDDVKVVNGVTYQRADGGWARVK